VVVLERCVQRVRPMDATAIDDPVVFQNCCCLVLNL
jgi:hypothetical protein